MNTRILFFLFIAITLVACQNDKKDKGGHGNNNRYGDKQKQEEQQIAKWDEMMAIHDEVMPKMADMNRTVRALRPFLEEGALPDKNLKEQVNRAINQIEAADEAMMDWMGEVETLEDLRTDKDHEAIMVYIRDQTEAISKVKADMLSSLANGKQLLATIEDMKK